MSKNQEPKIDNEGLSFVAAENLGKDLLQFMLQEFRAMPDVWHRLAEYQQNSVIERARERLESAVERVVNLIVSEGKVVVVADLEGVAIKDQIKASFIVAKGNETNAKEALYEAVGHPCTIIVADAKQFTGGMHEIKGEKDQRSMDLNTEYQEKEDMDSHDEKPVRGRNIAALPGPKKPRNRDD